MGEGEEGGRGWSVNGRSVKEMTRDDMTGTERRKSPGEFSWMNQGEMTCSIVKSMTSTSACAQDFSRMWSVQCALGKERKLAR